MATEERKCYVLEWSMGMVVYWDRVGKCSCVGVEQENSCVLGV